MKRPLPPHVLDLISRIRRGDRVPRTAWALLWAHGVPPEAFASRADEA